MSAVKEHFAQHRSHMWACGAAALLVIAAIVFSVPALAIVGAVICGSMMLAMVWMMVSMARHGHQP
jgi:hypothetical protein